MSKTPRRWSVDEDNTLLAEVSRSCEDKSPFSERSGSILMIDLGGKGDVKDWTAIAKALPGRTNKDCRKRWTNKLVGGLKKGPWDAAEDDRLLCAMDEYGDQWTLVAERVGGRSADQCAKRWHHSLNPTLDQSQWTPAEEKLLLDAVKTHGRAWKQIQKQYFSDRASNNVKNRYVTLTRRRGSTRSNKTSSTSTSDAALSADHEMDGLELSSCPSHLNWSSAATRPRRHAAMTMLDVDSPHNLTDFASTASFSSDLCKLVPTDASHLRSERPPLSFDNIDFSDLPDVMPDSFFDVSSATTVVQSPLNTPIDAQFDQYSPPKRYEDCLEQPMHPDPALPATYSDPFPQSTALTLTLDNPGAETMVGLMSYLAHSDIKFKLEMN